MLLLFPNSTNYAVNKRREHLSTEDVFVKQNHILPTDEQGKVKELNGRITNTIINSKG